MKHQRVQLNGGNRGDYSFIDLGLERERRRRKVTASDATMSKCGFHVNILPRQQWENLLEATA